MLYSRMMQPFYQPILGQLGQSYGMPNLGGLFQPNLGGLFQQQMGRPQNMQYPTYSSLLGNMSYGNPYQNIFRGMQMPTNMQPIPGLGQPPFSEPPYRPQISQPQQLTQPQETFVEPNQTWESIIKGRLAR